MALTSKIVLDGTRVMRGCGWSTHPQPCHHVIDDAYVKVESVEVFSTHSIATVSTTGYGVRRISTHRFNLDNGTDGVITQAYKHIKSLPEFSSSVDC